MKVEEPRSSLTSTVSPSTASLGVTSWAFESCGVDVHELEGRADGLVPGDRELRDQLFDQPVAQRELDLGQFGALGQREAVAAEHPVEAVLEQRQLAGDQRTLLAGPDAHDSEERGRRQLAGRARPAHLLRADQLEVERQPQLGRAAESRSRGRTPRAAGRSGAGVPG